MIFESSTPAAGATLGARGCVSITLSHATYAVHVNDLPIRLTAMQFDLLDYLIAHRDRVLEPGEIARQVFKTQAANAPQLVRVHIFNLRRALGEAGKVIETVRRRGYRLGRRSEG